MKLIAYLYFNDECEDALNFYQKALDGEITQISRAGDTPMKIADKDKNKIMHARLKVGESELYFSDTFGDNKTVHGNGIHLSLQPDDIVAMDRYFSALSEGGTVVRPPENTFWGARFGMLTDKFGIQWMLNCELKNKQ